MVCEDVVSIAYRGVPLQGQRLHRLLTAEVCAPPQETHAVAAACWVGLPLVCEGCVITSACSQANQQGSEPGAQSTALRAA